MAGNFLIKQAFQNWLNKIMITFIKAYRNNLLVCFKTNFSVRCIVSCSLLFMPHRRRNLRYRGAGTLKKVFLVLKIKSEVSL